MILINFAHPITSEQQTQIESLTEQTIDRVIEHPIQMDNGQPFEPQVVNALDAAGLTSEILHSTPVVLNLPGYAPAAACLLAEFHGRMGHFPTVIRIRPVEGSTPTRYEIVEVLNLQAQRERARIRRMPE